MPASQTRIHTGPGPLTRLAQRLGRETALYGSVTIVTFIAGIGNLAVLTHLLPIAEFGRLAIYLFFAILLTTVFNLCSLPGTLITVFGNAGEDGMDEEEEESGLDKRVMLGSGLVLTIVISLVGMAAVTAASTPLSHILLGESGEQRPLILAVAAASVGSVWRLAHNVLRFERRPWAYTGTGYLRPILVLVGTTVMVKLGYGIEGALVGTAAATAITTLIALLICRRSFRVVLDRRAAGQILRRGSYSVPFVLAVFIVFTADLYIVSIFLSDADVARYKVASRIGAGMSYFTSAFLSAWTPLTTTALYQSVQRKHGRAEAGGTLLIYFMIAALMLTLILSVLADVLIRVGPEAYASAAPIVPLMGLAFVVFGLYAFLFRLGQFPDKRAWRVRSGILAALIFVGASIPLVTLFGAYGAPVAQIVAFGTMAVVVAVLAQRGTASVHISVLHILAVVGVAVLCFGIQQGLAPSAGRWRPLVDLGAVALYPAALASFGVLEIRRLKTVFALGGLRRRRRALETLEQLHEVEDRGAVRAVEMIIRDGRSSRAVAGALDHSEEEVFRDCVAVVRQLAGMAPARETDAAAGQYLFAGAPVAERNRMARKLWTNGADPIEVDLMEIAVDRLRRVPRRSWRAYDRRE